jgi:hypothetical protein
MKKIVNVLFVVVLVLSLTLVSAPKNVTAKPIEEPSIAEGDWNTGTQVSVDLVGNPAPVWLQLLTKGVKIDAPTKICHAFRGGQFGWTGEIRKLGDGRGVLIPTVNDWVPTGEGKFMACAQATSAGTYALFGYYGHPVAAVNDCQYDTSLWSADLYMGYFEVDFPSDFPLGVLVTYQIVGTYPVPNLDVDQTGSTYTYWDGSVYATFDESPLQPSGPWEVSLLITTEGCSVVLPVDNDFPPPV